MEKTIFDKIVECSMPSWKVWEDNKFLAFLTPFGVVEGQTVVIPKYNPGDYIFTLDDEMYINLLKATRQVAKILERAFNSNRIAMVVEGQEVPYVHIKLFPITTSSNLNFHSEGKKLDTKDLNEAQNKIVNSLK